MTLEEHQRVSERLRIIHAEIVALRGRYSLRKSSWTNVKLRQLYDASIKLRARMETALPPGSRDGTYFDRAETANRSPEELCALFNEAYAIVDGRIAPKMWNDVQDKLRFFSQGFDLHIKQDERR